MPLLIFAGVLLAVLAIRIIVGLFTSPASTLAKLAGWIVTYLGIVALVWTGMSIAALAGVIDMSASLGLTIVAGIVTIVLFSVASWLGRVRRRAELRREYRLHPRAAQQVAKRAARQ